MSGGIYISTGEVSGEQHAARLATALRERAPTVPLSGMGTDTLAEAGVEIVVDAEPIRVIGFLEVLTHMPAIRQAYRAALEHIERTRPETVVLVDYPGFHLRLARAIRKRIPQTRILYYIAPKAWAWNEGRVKRLARDTDKVLCIFPFEPEWFGARGVDAVYVGNPTVDALRSIPDGGALRSTLGLPAGQTLISILPGSRRSECRRLLRPLVEAAGELRQHPEGDAPPAFALALAPGISAEDMNAVHPLPDWIQPVEGRTHELMRTSDLLLTKSGTSTLEAALLGTPMVVVYKASALSAWIARRVLTLQHVSLPNILAGRGIVPELLQEQATGPTIAAAAMPLLGDTEQTRTMRRDLQSLRESLGDLPAAQRTADAVLATASPK